MCRSRLGDGSVSKMLADSKMDAHTSRATFKIPGMVAHVCNASTEVADPRDLLSGCVLAVCIFLSKIDIQSFSPYYNWAFAIY